MKIALYMTTVLEHGGGMEKYLIETASRLAEEPGVQCDVITMDSNFTDRITSMLSVFYFKKLDKKLNYKENLSDIENRLGKARYHKLSSITSLRKKLSEYDVVYSKNELLESALFKFAVGYERIPPVIFGGHTPIRYPSPESFHARLHNALYGGFLYRFLAGPVSKFHVLNNYEQERYSELFSSKRVIKIYNPFDLARFKKNASEYPYELEGLNKNKLRVLWVGRLTEQKGTSDLVNIIENVSSEVGESSVEWTIVGDGEDKHKIHDLQKTHSNVHALGHVDQKKMASVYKQHQVFLGTSKWEGYPYTLIEAQAYGLQIYAYDIPGVNDILSVYDAGHLQKTLQGMERALIDEVKAYENSRVVNIGHATDQFEPKAVYGQLLSMFRTLVA